jgi:phosphoserine aminotransferase
LELGRNAKAVKAEHGHGFEFESGYSFPEAEMICVTQNETSSGVAVPMESIYRLKQDNPDALLAIDIVTSAPYVKPDFSMVDAAFFSVQKGFGMPAGLGVLIANEKTAERAHKLKSKGVNIGSYHNLITLFEYADKFQNPETPNVLDIYLLGKVCGYLNDYGAEKMRTETEAKAVELYKAIENSPALKPLVRNPSDRSMTIVIADAGEKQRAVKEVLLNNGYVVGSGYGKYKDREIRIANFPMHKPEDVKAITEILRKA